MPERSSTTATTPTGSEGPGKGSKLTVGLPLSSGPESSRPEQEPEVEGVRMLLVEDNQDLADLFASLLETVGHEVTVARDGEQALEKARSLRPEVILCDIGLPGGMDGYGVARALRADEELRDVFLVALTGHGHAEDIQCARDAGFDAHLIKPVDLAAIERLLPRRHK